MNQKQVLINLAAIANALDERKAYAYANAITQVMKRVAQQPMDDDYLSRPWWQNEAGEPMYSPEAIRAEERASEDYRYEPDDFLNDDYDPEDGWAEEQSERFQGVFDNWAASQPDLDKAIQNFIHAEQSRYMWGNGQQLELEAQKARQRIIQQSGEDTFDEKKFYDTRIPHAQGFDLRGWMEDQILANSNSHHQTTWDGEPDTMHDILDAVKQAMIKNTNIMDAINSVPAVGSGQQHYEGREDFGWGGDERLFGE